VLIAAVLKDGLYDEYMHVAASKGCQVQQQTVTGLHAT
jgi:hypothetical protein